MLSQDERNEMLNRFRTAYEKYVIAITEMVIALDITKGSEDLTIKILAIGVLMETETTERFVNGVDKILKSVGIEPSEGFQEEYDRLSAVLDGKVVG